MGASRLYNELMEMLGEKKMTAKCLLIALANIARAVSSRVGWWCWNAEANLSQRQRTQPQGAPIGRYAPWLRNLVV